MTPPDNKALAERLEHEAMTLDAECRITAKHSTSTNTPTRRAALYREAAAALREPSTPSAQSVERVAQPDGNYAVVLHPDFVDAQEAVDMARGGTTVILQKNIPPTPSAQVSGGGEVDLLPLSPHIVTELEHMKRDGWRHMEGYLYAYARACVEAALSTPQARPEVRVNFPQVGTAGPFSVIDGAITLPDETMNDLIRHARTGYVPAPTADGGAAVASAVISEATNGWLDCVELTEAGRKLPPGEYQFYTHPTPAPDAVARLIEPVMKRLDKAASYAGTLDAEAVVLPLYAIRAALADAFTAAQQEGES